MSFATFINELDKTHNHSMMVHIKPIKLSDNDFRLS